ncbi:gibberellin-regulated protein 12-like [Prunus avium]|uniref:Gibberellin-regulated protein 12-like n=1 Tax=Prunus avium TaxID=42229 RepID=A0A6P5SB19_PRUAV|nr:gibberellin-regulated protein 12-like [Prunus avium]
MARLSCSSSTAFFLIFALICTIDVMAQSPGRAVGSVRPTGGEGSLRLEQCGGACAYRCSATSHKNPCIEFCNMCCKKCLCVPSGTYGHKEECPCYNNWKTKEGGPKCP